MKKIKILIIPFFILLLNNNCTKSENKLFKKISSSHSKITFSNKLIESTDLNILTYLYYYNGAGVATEDFNNDGLIDVFFTSNQNGNKLYLNKGNFEYEDVTLQANILATKYWSNGVSHCDINNDGLEDIYICNVGNYKNFKAKNQLYINKGIDENGIPHFNEEASEYGLDFSGFSTQAAFFDYDLDGDLDMYLLNHSVHPNRTYGKGELRKAIDSLAGDRIYKNVNGKFIDVSASTNIFQGKIGYGLGIGISDLNNDGYPDVYIGNDFFENDYLYINQKNGTFKEIISEDNTNLGHTTHFSMGNDIADFNNDGLTDIVSVDMLPESLKTYKTSGLEFAYSTYEYYLKNGYAPQYMQNTLHLNYGNTIFGEIGNLANISATEWSWAPLLADFDNDGFKDLFITNGIKGVTNNMDFINFIANEKIQKKISQGMSKEDMKFIKELPEKKIPNYIFKNTGNLTFTNVSQRWMDQEDTFSNGSAYADFDNDGDLDLVVNNVNSEASIYQNNNTGGNYIKINFKGSLQNINGIGAKLICYTPNNVITQENFTTRGYLSSISKTMNIGLGKVNTIDSLKVIWPDGMYQTILNIKTNQKIELRYANAIDGAKIKTSIASRYVWNSTKNINLLNSDDSTIEFNREPLVPFASTNEGPNISIADINKDGLDDLFITGAKRKPSKLFLQQSDGEFSISQEELFLTDALSEDTSSVFFDANNDDYPDLLVVSGGNEFRNGKPLQPRLYINQKGKFIRDFEEFNDVELNASKVIAFDFENDGDLDIVITSDQVPWQFGKTPQQYLFINNGNGKFINQTHNISPEFLTIGNIKDIKPIDLNKDGLTDFIAVGNWMEVSIFLNDGKKFKLQKNNGLEQSNGLWNTIEVGDFDKDGDYDIIAGNWGINSKFKASFEKPIKLYKYDFDANGSIDPIITFFYENIETTIASKDEIVKQLPYLNKKFLSYETFANATVEDLLSPEKIKKSSIKYVYQLQTCYFENDGENNFKLKTLPTVTQSSSVHDIQILDFNNDGYEDILLVGNTYEISTQLGRLDANHGILLLNDKQGNFNWENTQDLNIKGAARSIEKISIANKNYLIVGINNEAPILLQTN